MQVWQKESQEKFGLQKRKQFRMNIKAILAFNHHLYFRRFQFHSQLIV